MSSKQHSIIRACLILCLIFSTAPYAVAAPAILDAGMSPAQSVWLHEAQFTNKEAKFWLKVQREGALSQYGTFDYLCRVQVLRPGGAEVFSTRVGFNEQGYAEQILYLPVFLYERSVSRSAPSFGTWKIRLFLEDRQKKISLLAREFLLEFHENKPEATNLPSGKNGPTSSVFTVPTFTYGRWHLKDWGVGIFSESAAGSTGANKQFTVLESRRSFSVNEVRRAWSEGKRFGVWITGPEVATYRDSSNRPMYLFGYTLYRPDGKADGIDPEKRMSRHAANPGSVAFPLDLRQPGRYRLIAFIRDRNSSPKDQSSWKRIGGLEFTLTR